jgi:hypothetical protein
MTFPDLVGRSAEELGSFRGEGDSIQKARYKRPLLLLSGSLNFLFAWVSRIKTRTG